MLTGAAVKHTGAATPARKCRNNGCATTVPTGYRSGHRFSLYPQNGPYSTDLNIATTGILTFLRSTEKAP